MKSTVRIALESQGGNLHPVIKIIQPASVVNKETSATVESEDEAPNDTALKNFLHDPARADRNYWFTLGTNHPIPPFEDTPTHYVSNIESVKEDELFYRFKHAIINRLIPYGDIVNINRGYIPDGGIKNKRIDLSFDKRQKIEEFFLWVEKTGYCAWEEQQHTDLDVFPTGKD